MQEHNKREEPLSEELLEGITGGTGGASGSGRTQGPTSFLNCPQCLSEAQQFGTHIRTRDEYQTAVDMVVSHDGGAAADGINRASHLHHQLAQESYQNMEAHGHPDFPSALRLLRLNYNPPL